jgi:hypothetical protein
MAEWQLATPKPTAAQHTRSFSEESQAAVYENFVLARFLSVFVCRPARRNQACIDTTFSSFTLVFSRG